ncbi:MAG: alanine--tRNA ligase [Candidatus Omnitrophica bacterium]|nr:alanine--tRNA ligase [Candidatus Omnitrophota bacterium]
MTGHEIRRRFLDYFARQGHTIVPSASLVPEDDPTVLFTGAGMNQFKDHFLGKRKDLRRAASCQTCFRTPDLEQVGKTASHLTFFEMLGNFSFGDYFKREAIAWAWEFLTKELKLPAEKLWITVYEQDDEALAIWRDVIKVPSVRIVKLGAKDNFWPSNAPADGPNGPCGPCSELHYDAGCCTIGQVCPDPEHCRPGCPCGRFVEVWNLVFTQFDRQPDGSLAPLPAKNIDTGMGLERLTAVVNGLRTNFETDLLKPIVEAVVAETRAKTVSPDVKAIADHVRALAFLIADGVVPSNDGRGYVARMLLRKAARHGRALGVHGTFLDRLVPAVVATMQAGYPDLVARRERLAKTVLLEEERYQQTLEEKMPLLDAELRKGLTPERAAWLYDTHGLPFEEITGHAQRLRVAAPERAAFDRALETLQAHSKAASGFDGAIFAETLTSQVTALGLATTFTGEAGPPPVAGPSTIIAILQDGRPVDQVAAGASALVVLDATPFYGESGGQMGDRGALEGPDGKLIVEDAKRIDRTIVHVARLTEGRVRLHDRVAATVDPTRRRLVTRNHTATHLLHAALRAILGPQAHQAGSLVAPDRLRFDFTSAGAVPAARLRDVEQQVNAWVLENAAVTIHADVPMAKAKALGALAFFGDKYGDRVRVVTISEYSKELCGGTHLKATGEVGVLTIVEEGSVASGVRRIEALTGEAAWQHFKGAEGQLLELAQTLKAPREQLGDAVERLRQQIKSLQSELGRLALKDAKQQAEALVTGGTMVNGVRVVVQSLPGADMGRLRQLADAFRAQAKTGSVVCLGGVDGTAVSLVVGASPDLAPRGITAQALIGRLAPVIGGRGGGRPEFAQAGGRDPSKLPEALRQVAPLVEELTKGR